MSLNEQCSIAYWTGWLRGQDGAADLDLSNPIVNNWFKFGVLGHPLELVIEAAIAGVLATALANWIKSIFGVKE